jgi:anti-sigma regulatory factor (Ser/Thr protein kinase)
MTKIRSGDEFVETFEASLRDVVGPIRGTSVAGWVMARLPPYAHASEIRFDQVRELLQASSQLTGPQANEIVERIAVAMRKRGPAVESRAVAIESEHDVVLVRGEAKRIAQGVGFDVTDSVKLATVVSELARNIVLYATSGRIELDVLPPPRAGLAIIATDNGPGIPNVDEVLSGKYRSRSGMGLGLVGSRRLVDELTVEPGVPRGTRVVARKYLSRPR